MFSPAEQSPLQLHHQCGITWKWVSVLLCAGLNLAGCVWDTSASLGTFPSLNGAGALAKPLEPGGRDAMMHFSVLQ